MSRSVQLRDLKLGNFESWLFLVAAVGEKLVLLQVQGMLIILASTGALRLQGFQD